MKIQLDFDNNIVTVEENVNFGEFVSKIKKIIPDWKTWQLKTNTVINNWRNPVVYRDWYTYNPFYYSNTPTVTCGTRDLTGNIGTVDTLTYDGSLNNNSTTANVSTPVTYTEGIVNMEV